jgi:hypothetical protein
MKPFHSRLKEYFTKVGKVLQGQSDAAAIFPNPTDVGMSREKVYAEFLRQHLPSSCNICLGGFLFDQEGNESLQIDIIITNDSSLKFDLHNPDGSGKSFRCVDGCIGVVSSKSNLNTAELENALENFASLNRTKKQSIESIKNPFINLVSYAEWPLKIIYALKGARKETILDAVNNFYQKNKDIPFYCRPNLIHVAGRYFISRAKIPKNTFWTVPDSNPTNDDIIALLWVVIEIQKIAIASNHILYNYRSILEKIPF